MKIGLVLSGGGARGVSHLGAVKALYEQGIRPDIISGTSAGAIAGGLLAYGYAPDEILEMIVSTNFVRYMRPTFAGSGLLQLDRLEAFYRKYIPENTFEALKTPLIVSATDIYEGHTVYFSEGELARPVLASSCLPGLFAPMHYQGRYLVDGGVLSNMPVEPLEGVADYIIGVHCNPFKLQRPPQNTREVLAVALFWPCMPKRKNGLRSATCLSNRRSWAIIRCMICGRPANFSCWAIGMPARYYSKHPLFPDLSSAYSPFTRFSGVWGLYISKNRRIVCF